MIKLPEILPQPKKKPTHLSENIKWLAGEGAGSWFLIEEIGTKKTVQVQRFSPEGSLECQGGFSTDSAINLEEMFSISYPSHCKR
ncbi:MAG: hypothetical protein ACJAY8_000247 [Sphingobacteriales bacterium]|jgi:hypothetical protein